MRGVDRMNLDDIIFEYLNQFLRDFISPEIKNIAFQIKITKTKSEFLLSFLLRDEVIKNEECDEIVIEISSYNSAESNYYLDLSDSLGNIYYKNDHILNENEFVKSIALAIEELKLTIKLLTFQFDK